MSKMSCSMTLLAEALPSLSLLSLFINFISYVTPEI